MPIGPLSGPGSFRPDIEEPEEAAEALPAAPAPTQAAPPRPSSFVRPVPGAAPVAQVGAPDVKSPTETVRAFYESLMKQQWPDMAAVYADDVRYSDPLFTHKDSASTIHMWRTLLQAENLKTSFEMLGADGDKVRGRWTADYTFHGRPVHEVSESTFIVKDGRIVSHHDDFSTVAWAKQALPLGPLERFADTTIGRAVITRLMRFGIRLAEDKLRDKDRE